MTSFPLPRIRNRKIDEMTATPRIRDRFFDATPQIFTSRLAHFSANVAIINKARPNYHNPTHKILNNVRAQGRPYHRYHRSGWFLPHRAPSREGLHCESFICPCRPPADRRIHTKCLRWNGSLGLQGNGTSLPQPMPLHSDHKFAWGF